MRHGAGLFSFQLTPANPHLATCHLGRKAFARGFQMKKQSLGAAAIDSANCHAHRPCHLAGVALSGVGFAFGGVRPTQRHKSPPIGWAETKGW